MNGADTPYRVLARKYRPADFAGLIGQEALVRTLSNALRSGRLAHAFILSGVRGVGKTTTARIIARALNCTGADGAGGPTPEPCGVCENCRAIAEDRHVDVIEMDAASRTGVGDIRELIEGVLYRPVMARTKVYIIDEVHMLSNSAFNALLKTLEEPPEHVKFVFATTEIHKVPVTVVSRCQRFDLRRVDAATLEAHFARIAEAESVAVAPDALRLIARAADGSVRDGLSLLDQAIALNAGAEGPIGEADIRDMLGLADGGRLFDTLEALMAGDVAAALGGLEAMHDAGADPLLVLQDLLDLVHLLTRAKVVRDDPQLAALSDTARERTLALAGRLSLPVLTRAWQMLLKGLDEARGAARPAQAAEMACVRLGYAADLPTPGEIAAMIAGGGPAAGGAAQGGAPPPPQAPTEAAPASPGAAPVPQDASPAAAADGAEAADALPLARFEDVVQLFAARREPLLHAQLMNNVRLVRYAPGLIEFHGDAHAPPDLARRIAHCLAEWTGREWTVRESEEDGAPTLRSAAEARAADRRARAIADPLVKAALEAFPGARVTEVHGISAELAEAPEPPDEDFEGDEAS